MKSIYLYLAVLSLLFCIIAPLSGQNVQQITLTLAATGNNYININATQGQKFSVDWGDGFIDVFTGQGDTETYCNHNYSSTTATLNAVITGNSSACDLTKLSYYCNNMLQIDLSKAPKLNTLSCGANQLTVLDVSNNTSLTTLYCGGNKLTALDVSKNVALQSLDCSGNRLTSLDVSQNKNLLNVFCTDNFLTELKVSPSTLYGFYCDNNNLSLLALYNLTLAYGMNGGGLFFGSQHIPVTYQIHAGEEIDFNQYELQAGTNDFSVTLDGIPAKQGTDYSEASGKLTFISKGTYEVSITNDLIRNNQTDPPELDISVIVDPSPKTLSLTYTIDKSIPNPFDRQISIAATPNTNLTIDWGDQTSNTYIEPDNGRVVNYTKTYSQTGSYTVTVTSTGDIISLYCSGLNTTSMDLSNCKALKEIYCSGNLFTSIDLSGCQALETFDCPYSLLSKLDVSKNKSLKILDCMFSKLTSIDLGDITNVQYIYLTNNAIPLNALYNISIQESTAISDFGSQTLPDTVVAGNTEIDLTNQTILGTTPTQFTIQKGNVPAIENTDFILVDGKLKFLNPGTFTITMTNAAILTYNNTHAEVTASYTVITTGLNNPLVNTFNIYPNPTHGIVYIETINNVIPFVKIFSMNGELLYQKQGTSIDLSSLTNNIYLMDVNGKTIEVIKY